MRISVGDRIAKLIRSFAPQATMSMPVMVLAIVTSVITGVLSGFAPAWRAARMNPVDALRSE
jgi:ABC-type antimicrobial peptide transport system permease subunit